MLTTAISPSNLGTGFLFSFRSGPNGFWLGSASASASADLTLPDAPEADAKVHIAGFAARLWG